MDLKECYEAFGGNYDEVKRRLMKDERIQRFLLLFPKDDNFASLEKAVEAQDWAAAFRAAHTLKGVSMNLNLDRLSRSAIAVTDMLRSDPPEGDISSKMEELRADYELTVQAIQKFQEGAG